MGALVRTDTGHTAVNYTPRGPDTPLDNHRLGRFLNPVTSMYHPRQADQQGRRPRKRTEW